MENTEENKQTEKEKDGSVKEGILLQAEDHIKITDKETGEVLLNKRG